MTNVRERMSKLIEAPGDDTVVIAGIRLSAPGEGRAWADRLRRELGTRFVERRPNASEQTWHRFLLQGKECLKSTDTLSDDLLQDLKVLIDGL